MSNPYLSRINAGGSPASLTSKISLGVSTAGLGLAASNFINNHKSNKIGAEQVALERKRNDIEEQQRKLDEKSLRALGSIHKALTQNVK